MTQMARGRYLAEFHLNSTYHWQLRAFLIMYIGPGPIISTMFITRVSENLSRAQRGDLDVFIKPPSPLMSDWPSELIEKCAFG